jgi:nucleotide-binding universal stress UspA family protein
VVPVGRVIVGVDGSVHSRAALFVAAEEARLRGATLQVLHAVYWDRIGTELITPTSEQLLEWGHKLVDAELAATAVYGEPTVVPGHPGEVLVRHSGDADLLVLGTRGRNPAASLLLGSVSEHCVRHARCPVLVTRADHGYRDDAAQASSTEAAT